MELGASWGRVVYRSAWASCPVRLQLPVSLCIQGHVRRHVSGCRAPHGVVPDQNAMFSISTPIPAALLHAAGAARRGRGGFVVG